MTTEMVVVLVVLVTIMRTTTRTKMMTTTTTLVLELKLNLIKTSHHLRQLHLHEISQDKLEKTSGTLAKKKIRKRPIEGEAIV